MNQPCLKLTTYFGERQRVLTDHVRRPGFLADAMLDLFDTREIAASVMLRGIASFGPLWELTLQAGELRIVGGPLQLEVEPSG